ncbi:MAG: hypothetical protein IRZ05_15515 [Micromonosporaceae bacterium]|nr:hypothetical protein [Micromonosporaceae bacterium]
MGWTLDELVRRAGEALAAQGVRAPSGRVTPLPDRRVVRWYATIGLVDRPLAYRGRTALYGERHLLQVVAVKRRQAEGRSLAEIQAELAGATDRVLREVARIGPAAAEVPAEGDGRPPPRKRFWAEPPTAGQQEDGLLYGVALAPGVTLMLPGQPGPADLTEIRAAARPLLDLLARRGLLHEGG